MRYGEWIARSALALIFLLNGLGAAPAAPPHLVVESRKEVA
jgi:hypothetical protein